MKINIYAVGKITNKSNEQNLIDDYLKRLPWKINIVEIPESDRVKEAKQILNLVSANKTFLVSFDEIGKHFNSVEFSELIVKNMPDYGSVTFVIGGHDGLDVSVLKKSNLVLSLGKMTWPHKIVRILLAEQLYRAYSISNNHPYHRGNLNKL